MKMVSLIEKDAPISPSEGKKRRNSSEKPPRSASRAKSLTNSSGSGKVRKKNAVVEGKEEG